MQQLFEASRCAVIANVGPLLEPTTKQQYTAKSVALPPQLFSHNDQQDQWHSLKGKNTSKSGWAGRVADALAASTATQQLSLNVSLAGQTLFQAGEQAVPYTMGASGPIRFNPTQSDTLSVARRQAFTNVANATYGTVYERGYADVQKRALQFAERVNGGARFVPAGQTCYGLSEHESRDSAAYGGTADRRPRPIADEPADLLRFDRRFRHARRSGRPAARLASVG